jgi:hypothetical protein
MSITTGTPFFCGGFEGDADGPGDFGIKVLELQALFLKSNFFKILIDVHAKSIRGDGESMAVTFQRPARATSTSASMIARMFRQFCFEQIASSSRWETNSRSRVVF